MRVFEIPHLNSYWKDKYLFFVKCIDTIKRYQRTPSIIMNANRFHLFRQYTHVQQKVNCTLEKSSAVTHCTNQVTCKMKSELKRI